jgi:hypothetical protein
MKYGTMAVGLLLALSTAHAQQYRKVHTRLEVRPWAAMYAPVGSQQDDFKNAATYGFQGAVEFTSFAHLVASGGYTNARSKIGALISPKTRMWQYDLGAEFNALAKLGSNYMLRPFLGFGAGTRSYKYEDAGIDTKTGAAAYAALGTDLQRGPVAFRLETRSYLSRFYEPLNSDKWFRNDYYVMFGLALHLN